MRLVSQAGHTVVVRLGEPGVSATAGRRVKKLVWYGGANRYGGPQNNDRDVEDCIGTSAPWLQFPCGGDSWALPTNVARAAALHGVTYNDFSNMNAGHFPDHSSHAQGVDVDVKWTPPNTCGTPPCRPAFAVNKESAEKLIALFESDAGAHIEFVYVTFTAGPSNEFWTTVRNAVADGQRLIPEEVATDAETVGADISTAKIWWLGRIRYRPGHGRHFHINWKDF